MTLIMYSRWHCYPKQREMRSYMATGTAIQVSTSENLKMTLLIMKTDNGLMLLLRSKSRPAGRFIALLTGDITDRFRLAGGLLIMTEQYIEFLNITGAAARRTPVLK